MTNNAAISNEFITPTKQIVFIDSQVEDYQFLAQGVLPGIETVILEHDLDGVEQITAVLNQRNDFTTIHVVSHGSPGCLYLGNSQLSLDTINQYGSELRSWFSPNFNVLESTNHSLILYGCNVGAGDVGKEFILKMCMVMNVEISASSTPIGNPTRDGNWDLDRQTKVIENPEVFLETVKHDYE